jgi:murein DD-endopeptidase MepM/ murein hydrolase activator NlpD
VIVPCRDGAPPAGCVTERREARKGACLHDDANLMSRSRPAPRRVLLTLLLTVPMVFSGLLSLPGTSADPLSDALAQQRALQRQISAQKAALAALQAAEARLHTALATTAGRLDEINTNQASVRDQIDAATQALEVVQAHYDELVAELAHLDWTLGLLEDELAQGQSDLALRKGLLAQRLADAYKLERTSLLEQILAADSLTGVLAQVGTYLRLGDQDAALAQEIERQRAALADLRRTTDATRFRTDQLRAQVAVELATVEQEKASLEAAKRRLDKLAAQTRTLQDQQAAAFQQVAKSKAAAAALLAAEQKAEDALSNEVDRLIRAQLSSGGIPSVYQGTLSWPMAGMITQEFGCTGFSWEAPLGNCAHFHRGIDIATSSGTPVHAAGPGVIVFVGWNPYDSTSNPAWIVIIAHSTHLVTWYGHMQPVKPTGIEQGAVVTEGQVVGFEGNTGHSTGPHLHWGVQLDNIWVNPRLFL